MMRKGRRREEKFKLEIEICFLFFCSAGQEKLEESKISSGAMCKFYQPDRLGSDGGLCTRGPTFDTSFW
jgi:hypothetical protein